MIDNYRPELKTFEGFYRHLHSFPELSGLEERTAATAAEHLTSLEFDVHTHIGGYGVAGVLKNGHGPTVLLRADMDALPLVEETGLPYASKRVMKDKSGEDKPATHACGHDFHVTALMAAASLLHSAREHWAGTLICVFQPAEEHLNGAKAMLDDGLYDKIPKPDLVLAQHVLRMRAGTVSVKPGPLLTAADAFDVRIFGRGGHGSAPQTTVDPILMGAAIVNRLQAIVSREVTPTEMAVLSCGSIHSGSTANIIPSTLDLKLNVRTFNANVRERVISSMKRIIKAECQASGAPQEPQIDLVISAPATLNDDAMAQRLKGAFGNYFKDNLVDPEPVSASEDFTLLATEVGVPYVMWTFGGLDEKTWDDAIAKDRVNELPGNHSPHFAPAIQPTLRTGVDAMALGALTFLNRN